MLHRYVRIALGLMSAAVLAVALPSAASAQNGTITGTVVDESSGGPLSTVQVYLEGTSSGGLTSNNGTFTLSNVPPGTYTLLTQRIGYGEKRTTGVSVAAGQTATVRVTMSPTALAIQGIVATGLVDPVEGVRSPITVSRVSREMMPVTVAGSAVQNLQGQVAGVQMTRRSGAPGSGVTMMLRTPTSIIEAGSPMIVVDGVILSGTNTTDIESLDIESMEVIKGAAAASLYGSRAAAGVISITTARGRGLAQGQTRFNMRSELGFSQGLADGYAATHHRFLMDPTNTFYVDANGNRVERNQRVSPAASLAFMDKPYPTETFDNIASVMRSGAFRSNAFNFSGNLESTNFAITLNNYVEQGALKENEGYNRNSARINLDHRFLETLSLGVSMYHSRDARDNIITASGQNPFIATLTAPVDIDFGLKNESGEYLQQPDPLQVFQNPLWTQTTRDDEGSGTRTLAGVNMSWSPFNWLTASGAGGYDRSDASRRQYTPKGTPPNVGAAQTLDGFLELGDTIRDTWNGEAQLTARTDVGLMNVRGTVRGILERTSMRGGTRRGEDFILIGIPQISNFRPEKISGSSREEEVRSSGYLGDIAFEYDQKYIFTALGRRDGSSLFGADNRWHNYYRVAGAWRLGEEPWFNLPGVGEFKLSYARGTAGGRPRFEAQYESWTLGTSGVPTKGNLGNRFLAPSHTLEQEVSLNSIILDRIGLTLTHAWQESSDQIVQTPQSVITGYTQQWVNAGTIAGHSTELELEAQMIQRPNLGWTSRVVADYNNSRIKEWNVPCQTANWRFYCTGEPVYGLYSLQLVESREQLINEHRGGDAAAFADEFQVNDEGILVWVGKGNDYREGFQKKLWGTTSGLIGGRTYEWGMPFWEQNALGQNHRQLIGEGAPVNIGWLNNLRLGNFNFHAALQSSIGGDANNRTFHSLVQAYQAPQMDQAGKEEGLKKPVRYYFAATQGDGSYTVENSSYLKLRTLSANYALNRDVLNRWGLERTGMTNASLGLVVRNVFTLTNYSGFDPEQALNLEDRQNVDNSGYPSTRSITAEISITF
jgi:TonB-linked SusC/RagA family outer membrane protein